MGAQIDPLDRPTIARRQPNPGRIGDVGCGMQIDLAAHDRIGEQEYR